MSWKKIRYGLNGLIVIPKTLQAYLVVVALCILTGLFWIVASLMPFHPFIFHGWTDMPTQPVCPATDINGTFKAEVRGGLYRVGHIKGIAYWTDANGDPVPGVVPIDADLVPTDGVETFNEVSDRIAPVVPGEARPAWDATINGWMFGVVPVNYEHTFIGKESIKVLPPTDDQCA